MQDAVMQLNVPLCLRRESWDGRPLVEGWNSARAHEYLLALQREIAANADEFADFRIVAVRWGGGLASMANAQDISDTMRLVRQRYAVADDAPVTLEASISNISGASMPFFRRAGITRFDFEMMQLTPMAFSRVNSTDHLGDLDLVADYFLKAYATDLLGMVLLYGFGAADPNGFRQSITAFLCSKASHICAWCAPKDPMLSTMARLRPSWPLQPRVWKRPVSSNMPRCILPGRVRRIASPC